MKSIWEKKPLFGKMRIRANTSDRMKKKAWEKCKIWGVDWIKQAGATEAYWGYWFDNIGK